MAKRSPILGYNHNVKYRGIVFHVQTEDSGLLSPHLFTHLFHGGVIVSTRKLVYDPGANEEAIKALMQAQHKAVMKDLRKGSFDEKIDQYLGGTEGLEPSAVSRQTQPGVGVPPPGAAAAAEPAPAPAPAPPPEPEPVEPPTAAFVRATVPDFPAVDPEAAIPFETLPANADSAPIELVVPKSRTRTAERSSPVTPPRTSSAPPLPPPPMDHDPATVLDPGAAAAAAAASANVAPPRQRATPPPLPVVARTKTPPAQVIELQIDDDDIDLALNRTRVPRDTALEIPQEVTIPPRTRTSDGVPARSDGDSSQRVNMRDASQPVTTGRPPTSDRPASHGAAALPPMKQPSRPSISSPARPAAPPAGDDDRPGSYSMGRGRPPAESVPLREQTGRNAAIPAAAAAPSRDRSSPNQAPVAAAPHAVANPPATRPVVSPPSNVPHSIRPVATTPIANRPHAGGSGVVMTRPAVIVGAPPKPAVAAPTMQRVRKAREDEGRGFGQGLISEKSLDEVILAYLSEDAEDK